MRFNGVRFTSLLLTSFAWGARLAHLLALPNKMGMLALSILAADRQTARRAAGQNTMT